MKLYFTSNDVHVETDEHTLIKLQEGVGFWTLSRFISKYDDKVVVWCGGLDWQIRGMALDETDNQGNFVNRQKWENPVREVVQHYGIYFTFSNKEKKEMQDNNIAIPVPAKNPVNRKAQESVQQPQLQTAPQAQQPQPIPPQQQQQPQQMQQQVQTSNDFEDDIPF